jgi:hypothetical protein
MSSFCRQSKDGVVRVWTDVIHSLDGDLVIINQRIYDDRKHPTDPYSDQTVTLEKHELEMLMPIAEKVIKAKR